MQNRESISLHAAGHKASAVAAKSCTDPIVGAILSGWRYDISSISPEMRTDYESHLRECRLCRQRQHKARTIDFLLIMISSLSVGAFLLAALVMRRLETLTHLNPNLTVHLRTEAISVSLQWVAIAGMAVSILLWILVAIATPLPGIVSHEIRQRITRRAA